MNYLQNLSFFSLLGVEGER